MDESIIKNNTVENSSVNPESNTELIAITDEILADARTDMSAATTLNVPIAQLATLGAGVASLIPALRTVTQTTTINSTGLYRIANKAVGDTLKVAKNGNYWGALKTADNTSKLLQLQSAGPVTAMSKSVAAINPATMMMAVALFSIEQQLGEIKQMQEQIRSFLEIEKESEIEADVETLSNIVDKYKLNWNNEHFVTSNHKMVLDIQRTARKNMLAYQKKASEIVKSKRLIVAQKQIRAALGDLLKKFKYYRLSVYTFAMASMMEIMLSGNFAEEYIAGIRTEIEKMSDAYRELFTECSLYLEKMCVASVEVNVLKGLGTASKTVGKLIGGIPVVKESTVDEFLQDSGSYISKSAHGIEENTVHAFAEISNPQTNVFVNRMDDMIRIYNHTKQIYFDDKQIYLVVS